MITSPNELKQELKTLYKQWPDIRKFLKSKGCPATDAEDLFQEALVIFCRKKQETDFLLSVEPFHYVKNICKLLWYNEACRRQKHPGIELTPDMQAPENDWMQREMQMIGIEKALGKLGRMGNPTRITEELYWLVREQKDYREQQLRQERQAFTDRISRTVFPCAVLLEWETYDRTRITK